MATEAAEAEIHVSVGDSRPRVNSLLSPTLLGFLSPVAAVLAGLYSTWWVLVVAAHPQALSNPASYAILVGPLVCVLGASYGSKARLGPTPAEIIITSQALTYRFADRPPRVIPWDSAEIKLDLRDVFTEWTELGGRTGWHHIYRMAMPNRRRVRIPEELYARVLVEAGRHHLVTRTAIEPGLRPGTTVTRISLGHLD